MAEKELAYTLVTGVDKTSGFDVIDTQIAEALAELRGARLDHAHCPGADNQRTVDYAELRLNRLLERRQAAGG